MRATNGSGFLQPRAVARTKTFDSQIELIHLTEASLTGSFTTIERKLLLEVFNKIKELKGLILAQNERWRRGLGMQVERQGFLSSDFEP